MWNGGVVSPDLGLDRFSLDESRPGGRVTVEAGRQVGRPLKKLWEAERSMEWWQCWGHVAEFGVPCSPLGWLRDR